MNYLISNLTNVKYLSGFTGSSGFVYISDFGKLYFITDARYEIQAKKEVRKDFTIYVGAIYDFIKKQKINEICLEDTIEYREFQKYCKLINKVSFISQKVEESRSQKSQNEIKIIKQAQSITEVVYRSCKRKLEVGISELEVVDLLKEEFRKHDVYEFSFDPIIAFGKNSAKPHHKPGNTKLKFDDVIQFDFGCKLNGYCSDFSRSVYFGKPSEKFTKIYNIVKEAQNIVFKYAKVGLECSILHNLAYQYIKSKGYGEYFTHSLGHSVGLDIHETPTLSKNDHTKIKKGMIFTVEPGIYIEGEFGIRLEDLIIFE
jgi:Xaa-Pro aminopeptidase